MKTADFSFAGAVQGALLCRSALAGEVHAAIDGRNSTRGHMICGTLRSADRIAWETRHAFQLVSLTANLAGVRGAYAISVFHDENDDGVLSTNLVGMPQEGHGVSNNHTYAMHAPNCEEIRFMVLASPRPSCIFT